MKSNKLEKIILIVQLLLILIIIMQNLMLPLEALATTSNTINTKLGDITLKTEATSFKIGDIIPIEIYISGENIVQLAGHLNYDKNKFEKIDMDADIEKPNGWMVAEGEDTEYGTEIFIISNGNKYACSNCLLATINFRVKEETNEADFSINYMNIVNTNFEDIMDEDGNLPSIEIKMTNNQEQEKLYLSSKPYKIGDNDVDNYEEGDKYISEVEKDTTKENFINNLETNGEIKILKANGTELEENGLIENGMILEVTKDDEKIELIIQVKEPESEVLYLSSEVYKIGNNDIDNYEKGDVYLDKIEPDTTVAKLKENCDHNGTLTVIKINEEGQEQILKDSDYVGTGMTIRVEGHNDKIELTAVVMDDLDGDGHVTATDLSTMKHVLQEEVKLEGAFFLAADLDDNEKITTTDLATINQLMIGLIKLTYTKNTNQ